MGDRLGFFNIHFVAEHRKINRGTLWGICFRKILIMPKKRKGGTVTVLHVTRKKRKNLFNLDEMV